MSPIPFRRKPFRNGWTAFNVRDEYADEAARRLSAEQDQTVTTQDRQLNSDEQKLLEEIHHLALAAEQVYNKMRDHLAQQVMIASMDNSIGKTDFRRIAKADPTHWLKVGKTHMQEGIVAWQRAVSQPEFF